MFCLGTMLLPIAAQSWSFLSSSPDNHTSAVHLSLGIVAVLWPMLPPCCGCLYVAAVLRLCLPTVACCPALFGCGCAYLLRCAALLCCFVALLALALQAVLQSSLGTTESLGAKLEDIKLTSGVKFDSKETFAKQCVKERHHETRGYCGFLWFPWLI